MKKPIEDGGGHRGIVIEDGGPLFERFIGGDADGPSLVALADDLKKQVCAGLVDGHIPEFIEGKELRFEEGFKFGLEVARVLRGQQGIDQIDGGDPPDGIALVAGAIAERQGEMRFAQADTAKEKYVALLGKPVEVEEVLDLGAIDLLGPGPIEIVERFDKGEPGGLNATL